MTQLRVGAANFTSRARPKVEPKKAKNPLEWGLDDFEQAKSNLHHVPLFSAPVSSESSDSFPASPASVDSIKWLCGKGQSSGLEKLYDRKSEINLEDWNYECNLELKASPAKPKEPAEEEEEDVALGEKVSDDSNAVD